MKPSDSTWKILPKQPGDYGDSFIGPMCECEDGTFFTQLQLGANSKITISNHTADTLYIDIYEATTIFCEKSKSCSLTNNTNENRFWISLKKAL